MTPLTARAHMMPRGAPAGEDGASSRLLPPGRRLDWRLGALAQRRWLLHAAALLAFATAAALSLLAHQGERPVTTAIIFLLGVTVVGAIEGVWGGLVAALIASALYNFFLAEPTFRFSFATLEDYVPLVAFNLSAVASGYLAGRLKDRAKAAETATRRVEALLGFSRQLQAAVGLGDVARALAWYRDEARGPRLALHIAAAAGLEPAVGSGERSALAERLFAQRQPAAMEAGQRAFLLTGADAPVGVLVAHGPSQDEDLAVLANLVGITVERFRLLGQLADAELVRRSEAFKTTLLSSVSHDMRTPLSAISASASSLARYGEELSEAARADMLAMIQEQCDRLNRYTTNLLNLGRLQAGVDPQLFTACDAVEALGAAIVQVRQLGGGHAFEKKLAVAEATLLADPVMLEQIFYNVLENAARHGGSPRPIAVDAEAAGGRFRVRIRDFGAGIAPDEIERVFERFHRAGQPQAREGTGLGLAIAKGFTEAFGGTIRAAVPDDGEGGTIVTIDLPLHVTGAGAP